MIVSFLKDLISYIIKILIKNRKKPLKNAYFTLTNELKTIINIFVGKLGREQSQFTISFF